MALNLTSIGTPCIYYGTEQAFDGNDGGDTNLRETMFGGAFGAFQSRGEHFFDEDFWAYKEIAKIAAIRQREVALRRGRQYLREISGNGEGWGFPVKYPGGQMQTVVPWSRVFDGTEIICAFNTDAGNTRGAWVTVDSEIHPPGSTLKMLYPEDGKKTLKVEEKAGRAAVWLELPKASVAEPAVVIYK